MLVIFKPENCYPPLNSGTGIAFDRVRLKAGLNTLSESDYQKLSEHPSFADYLDRKALVVQEPVSDVEVIPLSDTPANLSGYNVEDAGEIIDNTHDLDILRRWLSAETRKTTRAALTQRIKDLGGNP